MSQKTWIILLSTLLGLLIVGGGVWFAYTAGQNSSSITSSSIKSSSSIASSSSKSSSVSSSASLSSSTASSSIASSSSVASSSAASASTSSLVTDATGGATFRYDGSQWSRETITQEAAATLLNNAFKNGVSTGGGVKLVNGSVSLSIIGRTALPCCGETVSVNDPSAAVSIGNGWYRVRIADNQRIFIQTQGALKAGDVPGKPIGGGESVITYGVQGWSLRKEQAASLTGLTVILSGVPSDRAIADEIVKSIQF